MPKKIAPVPTPHTIPTFKVKRVIYACVEQNLRLLPRNSSLHTIGKFVQTHLCPDLTAVVFGYLVDEVRGRNGMLQGEANEEVGRVLGMTARSVQRKLKRTLLEEK